MTSRIPPLPPTSQPAATPVPSLTTPTPGSLQPVDGYAPPAQNRTLERTHINQLLQQRGCPTNPQDLLLAFTELAVMPVEDIEVLFRVHLPEHPSHRLRSAFQEELDTKIPRQLLPEGQLPESLREAAALLDGTYAENHLKVLIRWEEWSRVENVLADSCAPIANLVHTLVEEERSNTVRPDAPHGTLQIALAALPVFSRQERTAIQALMQEHLESKYNIYRAQVTLPGVVYVTDGQALKAIHALLSQSVVSQDQLQVLEMRLAGIQPKVLRKLMEQSLVFHPDLKVRAVAQRAAINAGEIEALEAAALIDGPYAVQIFERFVAEGEWNTIVRILHDTVFAKRHALARVLWKQRAGGIPPDVAQMAWRVVPKTHPIWKARMRTLAGK